MLQRLHLRHFLTVSLTGGACFIQAASARAQELPGGQAPEPKSWVLSYILVVLMFGLGLSLVCRSGNRRKDIRPDQLEA